MIRVDLTSLLEDSVCYQNDINRARRKSSSAISSSSSINGDLGLQRIRAEILQMNRSAHLNLTRSSTTSFAGLIFQFGGYDGKKYSSDFQVYTSSDLISRVIQLPSLEILNSLIKNSISFKTGPFIKVNHSSGTLSFSKYWLALRIKSQDHHFVKTLRTQHSLNLTSHSASTVEEGFTCLSEGTWPHSRLTENLLRELNLEETDLISKRNSDLLLENMMKMELFSTSCVAISNQKTSLYLDSDWLALHSGFYSEFKRFPQPNINNKEQHSMNSAFIPFIKLLLFLQYSLDCKQLKLDEVFEAFDAADYLICPLILKVSIDNPVLYSTNWRTVG